MSTIQSAAFFKPHWLCWTILGVGRVSASKRVPYIVYGILINIMISICYPIHLMLSFVEDHTQADNFKNFSLGVTSIAATLKFFFFAINVGRLHELEDVLGQLDARIEHAAEQQYFQRIRQNVKNIMYLFLMVYFVVGLSVVLAFVFGAEQPSLFYQAWYPFDWRASKRNFIAAAFYQFMGFPVQILQNYASDSYPPMALCLLSGHIHILFKRVARIGHENTDRYENELELKRCIEDQQHLYKLFKLIHEVISMPMFVQFTVTAINACVALMALLFFVDEVVDRFYYVMYLFAMTLELFPTCYYGSHFELLFGSLHYAVFSCNWTGQSRSFKRNMIIFTERTLKETTALAGGVLRIHLDTFFATCKGAYSLFAVVIRIKN